MKKVIALVAALTLSMGMFAGCGSSEPASSASSSAAASSEAVSSEATSSEASSSEAAAAVSGVVNTDGSTSMESVVKALAEAFMAENPDVTVNYSGTGSGTGIESATAGTCDIGLSSRALKEDETAAGAVSNVVALDGVVVNPENGVTDLTVEQIAQIFKGEITNWSQLGGADLEIAVYGREAGSGTRGAFEEIVGVEDACKLTNEYSSTGDVIGNVASNENAIGYASLSAVGDTVKAVKVGGIECSEATIKDGTYAIQRPFVMVTKDGAALSDAAQAFLDFAMSPDAAEIIAAAGAVSANA